MMNENNVDEKKLLNLVESNNKIHNEIRISKTQKWLAIYKILDNDQKQIWTKFHSRDDNFGEYKGKFKNKIKERFQSKKKEILYNYNRIKIFIRLLNITLYRPNNNFFCNHICFYTINLINKLCNIFRAHHSMRIFL